MSSSPTDWRSILTFQPDALSRRSVVLVTAVIVLLGVALRCVWLARVGWHLAEPQWHGTPRIYRVKPSTR